MEDHISWKKASMSGYKTQFRKVPKLTREERNALAKLFLSYYTGTNESRFLTDLNSKDEVLLLYFNSILVGFSTWQAYEREWDGQKARVVYSGDTVVDQAHWGQQALAFAWINRMGELKREKPDFPLYWFLIVKGHRTFKYLPTFGKSFYPHWSIDRSDLKPLADALAQEKFGTDFNKETGIVEFPASRGHLREDIALPTPEQASLPAVQFFLERNPGFVHGHELVCLCEIEESNMKPLTRRIFNKGIS